MTEPCYAIDDETAIRVTDGTIQVVSEGHWKLFAPWDRRSPSGSSPRSSRDVHKPSRHWLSEAEAKGRPRTP